MKQLSELWELFLLWGQWKKRKANKPIVDFTTSAGKELHLIKMQSGKTMRVKRLLGMNVLDEYQYLSYENETPFAQMTWPEYKEAHYGTN